jgi:hypothetical protein
VLLRRERNFALDKGGAQDGGGGAGMEKSTKDEAGSDSLEAEAEPAS